MNDKQKAELAQAKDDLRFAVYEWYYRAAALHHFLITFYIPLWTRLF